MTPDLINGIFEFGGSILTWMNVVAVKRDKGYAGVRPSIVTFFLLWGLWNLFYYPYLRQIWSFVGGVSIVLANCAWIWMMLYYGRKH